MIKFLYFDLGNVLVHFDHEIGCRNLANLLGTSSTEVRRVLFQENSQQEYETGLITTHQFCQRLNQVFHRQVPEAALELAASDIFSVNEPIFSVVKQLRNTGLPLGILSNTCPAHWNFLSQGAIANHLPQFDSIVLSYEVSSMKPDRRIYECATAQAGVAPNEILFVDDRVENVVGAQEAGFQAQVFRDVPDFVRIVEDAGLLPRLQ